MALAAAGVVLVRRWDRRRQDAAAEAESGAGPIDVEQWGLLMARAAGLDSDREAPRLAERREYPDDGSAAATHCKRLFQLAAGTELAQFAGCEKRIGSAIDARHVVIEPYLTGPADDPRPHPAAFVVTHELVDLGERPHLNPRLADETLDFAARAAVASAFNDAQLGMPVCLGVQRLSHRSISSEKLLMEGRWRLPGAVLAWDVIAQQDKIKASLGCDALHVAHYGPSGVRLVFGVPHDEVSLTVAGEAIMHDLCPPDDDADTAEDDAEPDPTQTDETHPDIGDGPAPGSGDSPPRAA